MTAIARRTVNEVLESLDTEFNAFAKGFCSGRYVLWIGSGVSRGVVPGVNALLQKVLEFLRERIDPANSTCPYRKAFDDILNIGAVPEDLRDALNLDIPVDTWPEAELRDVLGRLTNQYANVLNVSVEGKDPDFLVWEALEATTTYGDPALIPDAEHLCIAILILEGVVSSAPTTNWDGLVEAAVEKLTGHCADHLRVVVLPADLRDPDGRPELIKFHGCAVLAAANESVYRRRLIARSSQISGWTHRAENRLMMNRLSQLFTLKSSLIVGLSVQDANIQSFFSQGSEDLGRSWPVAPPAVVFAEEVLQHTHALVLQVAYGDDFGPNQSEIETSALLGAYARPVLLALVLFVLTDKLCFMIELAIGASLASDAVERVHDDLRSLRDTIGALAAGDLRAFVEVMAATISFALGVFRTGRVPDPSGINYQSISAYPIRESNLHGDFPSLAFGRLGIALSLLSRGASERAWDLRPGSVASASDGVVSVTTSRATSRVFVVSDSRALSELGVSGVIDLRDNDLVVLQAEAAEVPSTRSPRSRYGRTGTTGARQVDLEHLCATVTTADELFEAFSLEAGL